MKAIVTSIGEPTTKLAAWALERQGFEVQLVMDSSTTLAQKLKWIYNNVDENFVRVDADVIVNQNIKRLTELAFDDWWVQALTFDWFKQDTTTGGASYIKKQALPALRANIDKFMEAERPESQMYRLDEFHNPRRCRTENLIVGLHGYKQTDIERIKATKERRKQTGYDWELAERISA